MRTQFCFESKFGVAYFASIFGVQMIDLLLLHVVEYRILLPLLATENEYHFCNPCSVFFYCRWLHIASGSSGCLTAWYLTHLSICWWIWMRQLYSTKWMTAKVTWLERIVDPQKCLNTVLVHRPLGHDLNWLWWLSSAIDQNTSPFCLKYCCPKVSEPHKLKCVCTLTCHRQFTFCPKPPDGWTANTWWPFWHNCVAAAVNWAQI